MEPNGALKYESYWSLKERIERKRISSRGEEKEKYKNILELLIFSKLYWLCWVKWILNI
jgi:hypothetical protein